MSRKQTRREQRHQDELEELQTIAQDTDVPLKDNEPSAPTVGFAALQLDDPEEESEPEPEPEPEQRKSKSKNKNKKKSKKNKGAKKQIEKTDVNSMSIEEMTALLDRESGAAKNAPSGTESAKKTAPAPAETPSANLRTVLSPEGQHLDPQVELRRQFGAGAIKAYEREKGSVTTRAGARRGAAHNSNMRARTVLSTPKPTWPDMGRTIVGLTMNIDETPRGKLCSWAHSRAYRQAQMQFSQAVNSFDTEALYALFRVFPWHIDTLLQLSDISRYQGDLGQASDFIERALFAFERTAAPQFVTSLTSSAGPMGVDFLRAENRAVWLAMHRNIDLLCRRGTWRTALEWCKLVFALDTRDPHGVMMWMDFLALKSGQHAWLLKFYNNLAVQRAESLEQHAHVDNYAAKTALDHETPAAAEPPNGALHWSVGMSFSRALALRALEKEEGDQSGVRSRAALRLAIARHPAVLPILCSRIDIVFPEDSRAMFTQRKQWSPRDDALDELLGHLYVHRSLSLWKEKANVAWLKDVMSETLPELGSSYVRGDAEDDIKLGIYRHVVVADLPESLNQQLVRYFPPDVRSPAGGVETFDPLPPPEGTRYGNAYYAPLGGSGLELPQGRSLYEMLARLGNVDMNEWDALVGNLDEATRDQYVGALMADLAGEGHGETEEELDETEDEAGAAPPADAPAGAQAAPETAPDAVPAQQSGTGEAQSTTLLQRLWNSVWGS